jgi:hypothetical protein
MKKTIKLTHEKIKYPRMIDAAKNEVRKYIKRERRIALPEGVDFWDFDCRFGDSEADAAPIHLSEIDACINEIEKRQLESFYVEVIRKEGIRKKPARPDPMANVVIPKPKRFGE